MSKNPSSRFDAKYSVSRSSDSTGASSLAFVTVTPEIWVGGWYTSPLPSASYSAYSGPIRLDENHSCVPSDVTNGFSSSCAELMFATAIGALNAPETERTEY